MAAKGRFEVGARHTRLPLPIPAPEDALNPARIDWIELLFSSTGRLPRTAFLTAAALLLALAFAYQRLGAGLGLGWIVYPALLFPAACILSKRLHDRGRAGWWAFAIVWALVEVWPTPVGPLGYAAAAVLALGFVELGLMPGRPGANRFGPGRA